MVEKECGGVKQTMNAFEMELKKILSQSKEAAHTTYVGIRLPQSCEPSWNLFL